MNIVLNQFFSAISNYQISEFIYLGKVLHFFIPMMITLVLKKKSIRFNHIIGIVFIIGLGKELYDLSAINSSVFSSIQDIVLDLSYPFFCAFTVSLKKNLETTNQVEKITFRNSLYLKSENAYLDKKM